MRPVRKGASPYSYISEYGKALPFLEERLGSYCSYCGFPLDHAPEVEHIVSKSKNPSLATSWENLLLGCKYCNTRKGHVVDSGTVDSYLWPDVYNTALAFTYEYGVPKLNETALNQVDSTGNGYAKAKNLFDLIKYDNQTDRRTRKRNEAYQKARMALQRWQRNRHGDMKEQIVDTAVSSGFFSLWTQVFSEEPEILCALIDAFPGTERTYFDANGHPKPILSHPIASAVP